MGKKNDPIEEVLKEIFSLIIKLLKTIPLGIKGLKEKNNLIKFFLSFMATIGALLGKAAIFSLNQPDYLKFIIFYLCVFFPIIFLIMLGAAKTSAQKKYNLIFEKIDFKGKDGKYPILISQKTDSKKKIYLFFSNIPLEEWKKKQSYLETGIDCNILLMSEGKNKNLVEVTTVPSSCRIPEKIDWNDEMVIKKDGVICIGESALNKVIFDLNKTPHILIAGETGSGKSVILRIISWQMVIKGTKMFYVDFKGGVEFGIDYERFGEVITERERAVEVFETLVQENKKRLKLFRDSRVKNLYEYNKKTKSNLCRIAVISDEIGEMLDKKGASKEDKAIMEDLEKHLSTLARLSRATGINLFLGVQRPDANVLTGQIKNNIPVRVSGRFADKSASEIVLGNTDAVNLPDIKGRFLYKLGNDVEVFQAYYFDDDTMLTDVDVEQGTMLIEKDTYKPVKQAKPGKPKAPEKDVELDLDF